MTLVPTIYIVDDDESCRKTFARMLAVKGFRSELFQDADSFLATPGKGHGCILLDVRMPGLSGIQLQQRLVDALDLPPIIFISGHADIPVTVAAMKGGAVDFLSKPVSSDDLLRAVSAALEVSEKRHAVFLSMQELESRFAKFTPREREVFDLVIRGRLNKQIAFELGTTERTIKAHRHQVMSKMEASTIQQLMSMAQKLELVDGGGNGDGK